MRAAVCLVAVLAACGRFGFSGRDGATMDGATGDGARSDGARDGAGADAISAACPPGVDLCDSFETGVNTATWTLDSMVTLDTTFAHRGSASIHVHSPAFAANVGSYQTMTETKTIATGATTFWVRAWFWLSALPATGNGMELISAERPSSAGDYLFVFSDSTHVYSQFGGTSQVAMTTVPVGSWFCAIFKVVRSTTNTGSLESSGDVSALLLSATKTDSTTPMTIITLGIGISATNAPVAQPALDLWIDDVIVHTSAVTCAE